eukprot:4799121-Ditylum_brightwellii.AAC.1
MKEDLHKAILDVETLLDILPEVLPEELFNQFDTFPAPRVLPAYSTSYSYTAQIMFNVLTMSMTKTKIIVNPQLVRGVVV